MRKFSESWEETRGLEVSGRRVEAGGEEFRKSWHLRPCKALKSPNPGEAPRKPLVPKFARRDFLESEPHSLRQPVLVARRTPSGPIVGATALVPVLRRG